MDGRKQQLLQRHRRHKRLALLLALAGLVAVGICLACGWCRY